MPKKIFFVDDDASIIKVYDRALRPQLEMIGVEVQTYLNPDDALQAIARDGLPDAVVTDDRMPFMTGRELAVELRARGFTGKILMVSGTADDDVLVLGVDQLLQKPVDTPTLRNAVRGLLG